jgi:hypothetical protein
MDDSTRREKHHSVDDFGYSIIILRVVRRCFHFIRVNLVSFRFRVGGSLMTYEIQLLGSSNRICTFSKALIFIQNLNGNPYFV